MLRTATNIVLSTSFALLLSCKGKDPDPIIPKCFVATITQGTPTEYTVTTFTYTDDNKLVSTKIDSYSGGRVTTTSSVYTYDSRGHIIRILYPDIGSKEEFSYDANDRLSTNDIFDNTTLYGRLRYEYNADGRLTNRRFYYVKSNGQESASFYSIYEYADIFGQNPTKKMKHYTDPARDYAILCDYDYKRTPFASSPEFKFILGEYFENNIIKQTDKYSRVNDEFTTNFTYTYNDKGFPTSVSASHSTEPLFSIQYTYNCK